MEIKCGITYFLFNFYGTELNLILRDIIVFTLYSVKIMFV